MTVGFAFADVAADTFQQGPDAAGKGCAEARRRQQVIRRHRRWCIEIEEGVPEQLLRWAKAQAGRHRASQGFQELN